MLAWLAFPLCLERHDKASDETIERLTFNLWRSLLAFLDGCGCLAFPLRLERHDKASDEAIER